MERPETEAELAGRMQHVTDQLSASIVSVDCSKAEMADLLLAHALKMLIEEHGARKTAQSLFLMARSIISGEEADMAAAEALRRAGGKLN